MDIAEEEIAKMHLCKIAHGCQNKSARVQKALFQLYFEREQENGEGIGFLSFIA